ncbi:MAG TPA: potassium-transporting ATPase subunit C [Acidimicrobiales bacterium]|nr:potassium-transporting ATPase subunit C [Acidimicrobiales bacterium]
MRRQILPAVTLVAAFAVITGLAYPLAVWGIGQATMPWRANGSFITRNGQVVGSALIGQSFLDKDGNPLSRYFQPRPSAAGDGYDATASGASNLGPGDPRLVGFIPGFNSLGLDGNPSSTNPFATPADPYCVPVDAKSGSPVTSPGAGQQYAKDGAGHYVCDTDTVPERAIAYRVLNGLPAGAVVPADAVTASNSGLDPDISVSNADLQARRVAAARHLPVASVASLIAQHTDSRRFGILGERTVNVLDLNLALDSLR